MSVPPWIMPHTAMAAPSRYRYTESRLMRGKATSCAPIMRGRKKLPKMPGMAGIMKRKIMITPCSVNMRLYVIASMTVGPGVSSSSRSSSAKTPPRKKPVSVSTR